MTAEPKPLAAQVGAGALGRDGALSSMPDRRRFERGRDGARLLVPWSALAAAIILVDAVAVAFVAGAVGELYYRFVLERPGLWSVHLSFGILIAALFAAISIATGRYRPAAALRNPQRHDRLAFVLLASFASVVTLLFLTQTSTQYSRSVVLLSFVVSFPLLALLRSRTIKGLSALQAERYLRTERVLVVGPDEHVDLAAALVSERPLIRVIGRAVLPTEADHDRDSRIDALVAIARRASPDTIVVQSPVSRETLLAVVSKLMELPSAILLGTDPAIVSLVGRARHDRETPIGTLIVGPPLTRAEQAAKRCFDVFASASAAALLSPLFLTVGLLVMMESGRPVFFRQTRFGYNRRPFEVWKFRTLSHRASAEPFRQVTAGDDRVTVVGRFLRRTNLDELPQLLNVLGGSMSLVGPRPHPVELDERFDPLIAHYARRYKIRPGITGWAQVNGLRGETNTVDRMEQRISHDIYYVSNWSLLFDIRILLLTVLSARSYRNAK